MGPFLSPQHPHGSHLPGTKPVANSALPLLCFPHGFGNGSAPRQAPSHPWSLTGAPELKSRCVSGPEHDTLCSAGGIPAALQGAKGASGPYICYMGRVFGEQPDPGANRAGPSVGQLPQGEGRGFGSWSCALSPWDGPRCGQGPLSVTLQGVEVMGVPQRAPRGASPRAMGIRGPQSPPWHGSACTQQRCAARRGAPCVPGHPMRCHPAHAWQGPLDNHPSPEGGKTALGCVFPPISPQNQAGRTLPSGRCSH